MTVILVLLAAQYPLPPAFDPDFAVQQYGIVALGFEDKPATYTGADTPAGERSSVGFDIDRAEAVAGPLLERAVGPPPLTARITSF